MLSTVVLPAPLGPIKAGNAPGFGGQRHVVGRAHAAKGDAEAVDGEGMALTRNRQKSVQRKIAHLRRRPVNAGESAVDETDDAFGRQPEHQQQQRAECQQAVLGERGDQLGQHDDDGGADHRSQGVTGTADDDGQQKQDRLRERETIGRDKSKEWPRTRRRQRR